MSSFGRASQPEGDAAHVGAEDVVTMTPISIRLFSPGGLSNVCQLKQSKINGPPIVRSKEFVFLVSLHFLVIHLFYL
jgi:hypothetical protein